MAATASEGPSGSSINVLRKVATSSNNSSNSTSSKGVEEEKIVGYSPSSHSDVIFLFGKGQRCSLGAPSYVYGRSRYKG